MASLEGADPGFRSAIEQLIAASGGRVWLVSGYRSEAEQSRLWNNALAKYGSEAAARKWVAPPGKSNHGHGIAADLGGDLSLAARLAPRFGLHRPMSWEPWHFEPLGGKGSHSDDAYTIGPNGERVLDPEAKSPQQQDYGQVLASMLGMDTDPVFEPDPMFGKQVDPMFENANAPPQPSSPVFASRNGGPDNIDRFMAAIRSVESSGNYSAVGVPTQWGRATGAYQFLDSTWGNYKGYSKAKDAPPEIQDEKARILMQEYHSKFGSWDRVAASWFSGPAGNHQSSEVRNYVGKVMGNF